MSLRVHCPGCGADGEVDDELAGETVKCECGADILVPVPKKRLPQQTTEPVAPTLASAGTPGGQAAAQRTTERSWLARLTSSRTVAVLFVAFLLSSALAVWQSTREYSANAHSERLVGALLLITGVLFLVALLAMVVRWLWRLSQSSLGDKQQGEHGYISFGALTAEMRENPLLSIVLFAVDILMLPFPFFFHQWMVPNLRASVWQRWVFLRWAATSLLTYTYLLGVMTFYAAIVGAGVGVVVSSEYGIRTPDIWLKAIGWAAGAGVLQGLFVCGMLMLGKAAVELVTVFLNIEKNTRGNNDGPASDV